MEFQTEDMKEVMQKIMKTMQESDEETQPTEKSFSKPKQSRAQPPKKPQKKGVRASDFVKSTWNRMNVLEQKRRENLLNTKKELDQEMHKTHTNCPVINENSRKLLGKNSKPIGERSMTWLSDKNERISRLKERIQTEKEEGITKELTFKPKLTKMSQKLNRSIDFYTYNQNWAEEVSKKTTSEREKKAKDELEGVTFKPKIKKYKFNGLNTISAFDRLHQVTKQPGKRSHSEDPFKPKILNKSRKMASLLNNSDVYDRLFNGRKSAQSFNFSSSFSEKKILESSQKTLNTLMEKL